MVRGAATLCMALVGVVFSLLLAGLDSILLPWVNAVVHYAMPVVVVADWLIDPPNRRITLQAALRWLAIPFVYVAYTLVRGATVHWYPYPFLNVDQIGYRGVLGYCLVMLVGVAIGAWAVSTGNARRARGAT